MSWSKEFTATSPAKALEVLNADTYLPDGIKAVIATALGGIPIDKKGAVYVNTSGHFDTSMQGSYNGSAGNMSGSATITFRFTEEIEPKAE